MAKNIYWSAYGIKITNPDLPSKVNSMLFICYGNICRSPFAEKMAKQIFQVQDSVVFASAGIHVESPMQPTATAIDAAIQYGVDLKDHLSKSISYNMMESYDMILTMESWQQIYLNKLFAEFSDKIFLLPLFRNNKNMDTYHIYNIQDPFGRTKDDFMNCYEHIKNSIEDLCNDLKKDIHE